MSLASRAFIEFCLTSAKKKIEEVVLQTAKNGERQFTLPCLPCGSEHVANLIDWMRAEGLFVEHKKWMAVSSGPGTIGDEEETEHSQYVVRF